MTRVKRGVAASKRRKNLLEDAKGYRWRRKSTYRAAKQAVIKAGSYALRDRRAKKRTFRGLWITRLNIAAREHGVAYRELISLMTKNSISLDRKVLSELAITEPKVFAGIMEQVKNYR
jgi:large subunit ribosomal protein L20